MRKQWSKESITFPEFEAFRKALVKPQLDKEYLDFDDYSFGSMKIN